MLKGPLTSDANDKFGWINPHAGGSSINYDDIKSFIRRYYITITLAVGLCIGAAAIYLSAAVPLYTARAQLLIDAKPSQLFRAQSGEGDLSLDSAQVESQIAVMQSEKVMA